MKTIWKGKAESSSLSGWRTPSVYVTVNKTGPRYQYRVIKDHGYPDHSGLDIVIFGYAETQEQAYNKAESEFNKHDIKDVFNARSLHPLYDDQDTLRPKK
jgi:hypothetical protein